MLEELAGLYGHAPPIWNSINFFHKSDHMVISSKEGSWADWWGWIALFKKIADILSFSFFMLHVKTDFVSACLFVMFSLSCLKKDARMKQTGV